MTDTVLETTLLNLSQNYTQAEGTQLCVPLECNFVQLYGFQVRNALYASTYMGDWESELLKRVEDKPTQYYRSVDDIFGVRVPDDVTNKGPLCLEHEWQSTLY